MRITHQLKLWSAALLAGALVLTASACSGGPPSGGGSSQIDVNAPVTLEMWTGQTEEAQDLMENLAKEFTKEHPNVTLEGLPGRVLHRGAAAEDLRRVCR